MIGKVTNSDGKVLSVFRRNGLLVITIGTKTEDHAEFVVPSEDSRELAKMVDILSH